MRIYRYENGQLGMHEQSDYLHWTEVPELSALLAQRQPGEKRVRRFRDSDGKVGLYTDPPESTVELLLKHGWTELPAPSEPTEERPTDEQWHKAVCDRDCTIRLMTDQVAKEKFENADLREKLAAANAVIETRGKQFREILTICALPETHTIEPIKAVKIIREKLAAVERERDRYATMREELRLLVRQEGKRAERAERERDAAIDARYAALDGKERAEQFAEKLSGDAEAWNNTYHAEKRQREKAEAACATMRHAIRRLGLIHVAPEDRSDWIDEHNGEITDCQELAKATAGQPLLDEIDALRTHNAAMQAAIAKLPDDFRDMPVRIMPLLHACHAAAKGDA